MNRLVPCAFLCLAALITTAGCVADTPVAPDPERAITAQDLAAPGEPAAADTMSMSADTPEEGGAICITKDGSPYEATSC